MEVGIRASVAFGHRPSLEHSLRQGSLKGGSLKGSSLKAGPVKEVSVNEVSSQGASAPKPSSREYYSAQTQLQNAASVRGNENQALLEQQSEVRALAATDREVRAHETAHAAVGGAHAGGPNFQFTSGPNGQRYATSGHVNIDISPVKGDPSATLAKMQTVARAALAPAEPSVADRAVAAKANVQAVRARAELAQQAQVDIQGTISGANQQTREPGSLIDVIV